MPGSPSWFKYKPISHRSQGPEKIGPQPRLEKSKSINHEILATPLCDGVSINEMAIHPFTESVERLTQSQALALAEQLRGKGYACEARRVGEAGDWGVGFNDAAGADVERWLAGHEGAREDRARED
jgi:hypothetical protein